MTQKIGMIGLGPMGRSLALNMKDHDLDVVGFDISEQGRNVASDAGVSVVASLQELADSFSAKKVFWIMVPSKFVDDVMNDLKPHLANGDVIIEGGNSHFSTTERRVAWAKEHGVVFIGAGVSGGEQGARYGPCIMPGGDKSAYDAVAPILTAIAAKVDNDSCVAYIGPRGAGHFVKTVHNGIEYAIMQSIAEAIHLLQAAGVSYDELHKHFKSWSESDDLGGFLMEITASILAHKDAQTQKPFLEIVLDTAGQKGTGKWTSQSAYDLGIPVHAISAALVSRFVSALKTARQQGANVLQCDLPPLMASEELVTHVRQALLCTILGAYAQGFALLQAGSQEYEYNLDFVSIARIWRGGCIIRSKQLQAIMDAFTENSSLTNLLFAQHMADIVKKASTHLRSVVCAAATHGIPAATFSMTLAYIDSLRFARLPSAAVIQAQRDFFGSHTYQRVDKEGTFHTLWSKDMSEVKK